MQITKQLSIFMENQPGNLAKICILLKEKQINISGFSVLDAVDHAVVRLVTTDPAKAIHLLGESGILAIEGDILDIEIKNEPGELARIAEQFSKHKINIDYAYASSDGEKARIFMKVTDPNKAIEILKHI